MTNFKLSWQLYEPKPEPIFTTGDKVTDGVIEGTIIHIEDAIADVCPSTDEYKIELRNLNHIPESPKQDDVEKPLRSMIAEAKAIGKNIRTYYQDIVFTPQALEACLNQGKFRWWNICNWELTTREQNYFPSISTSSDRPKPGSLYKVGDLVEYRLHANGDNMMGQITYIHRIGDTIEVLPVGNYDHNSSLSTYHVIYASRIIRKLKPSEIVVRIGCLSGTVVHALSEDTFLLAKVNDPQHRACCIDMSMLDTQTREIVEGLLRAQMEEE